MISPQGYSYGKKPQSVNPFWEEDTEPVYYKEFSENKVLERVDSVCYFIQFYVNNIPASVTTTLCYTLLDTELCLPFILNDKSALLVCESTEINNLKIVGVLAHEPIDTVRIDLVSGKQVAHDGKDGKDGVTPTITATASVDANTGTPSVEVTKSGTDAAPTFNFAFTGLKGEGGGGSSFDTSVLVSSAFSTGGVKGSLTVSPDPNYTVSLDVTPADIQPGDIVCISDFSFILNSGKCDIAKITATGTTINRYNVSNLRIIKYYEPVFVYIPKVTNTSFSYNCLLAYSHPTESPYIEVEYRESESSSSWKGLCYIYTDKLYVERNSAGLRFIFPNASSIGSRYSYSSPTITINQLTNITFTISSDTTLHVFRQKGV